MLTRNQKEGQVNDLKDKFQRATSVIVADYRGIDVQSVNDLRSKLREGDYEYRVAKNTLLKRAVEGSDAAALVEHLSGPTAVAFSYEEPVGLAKVLVAYAKENEAFELKGGVLEGRAVDSGEIATLATLPSLQELRAKLVGLLQAPAQKVLGVVQAPAGQLARVVEARRGQLEEGGS